MKLEYIIMLKKKNKTTTEEQSNIYSEKCINLYQ